MTTPTTPGGANEPPDLILAHLEAIEPALQRACTAMAQACTSAAEVLNPRALRRSLQPCSSSCTAGRFHDDAGTLRMGAGQATAVTASRCMAMSVARMAGQRGWSKTGLKARSRKRKGSTRVPVAGRRPQRNVGVSGRPSRPAAQHD